MRGWVTYLVIGLVGGVFGGVVALGLDADQREQSRPPAIDGHRRIVCVEAVRRALAAPAPTGDRPPACSGFSDEEMSEIVTEVLARG